MLTLAFVLLSLSWLNPLHIAPWVSWHNEVLVFGAASLLFIAALRKIRAQSLALRIPYSALIWPALASLVILQAALGRIEFLGDVVVLLLYFTLTFITITSSFVLVANQTLQRDDQSMLSPLAAAILLGAVLSTLIAIVQTLDVWPESEWISRGYGLRRPGGNLAQPNQLATLQLMGLVSLNYFFSNGRLRGIAVHMLFGLLIAGVGLTESRSGVLGATALVAFAIVHRNRALKGQPAWYGVAGLIFLVACFKFLPVFSFQFQQAGAPVVGQLAVNLTVGTRLTIWPQLIEASLQHPWIGWGLRQVPLAHNAVLHNYASAEAFTYAHNIILDLVLGVGYPLTIAAVGFFSFWAFKRLRALTDPGSWYCMALLIPLVVHSLLEFPFAYAYFLMPVAFAIGAMEARLFPGNAIEVKWVYAVIGHAFFVAILIWSTWEYIAIEEDFRVARFEALRIGHTSPSYERPNIILFTQMDAVLAGIRMVPKPSMSSASIEQARKVAMHFPWPATQNRYALCLALNGNPDEAVRQLKVIRAIHGEKAYQGIKANWQELASSKYPQLSAVALP